MKIRKLIKDSMIQKCPSCNWKVNALFGLRSWEEKDLICGDCFCDYLINKEVEVGG